MDRETLKTSGGVLGIVVVVGAGVYMLVKAFWYFHHWDLALWQWIAAVLVAPITFVVVPFYVGFTEGDWSLVVAWAVALIGGSLTGMMRPKR